MGYKQKAFSTLEALMALSVMAAGLSCAILVMLGSRALMENSIMDNEALEGARDLMELRPVNADASWARSVISFQTRDAYTREADASVNWQAAGRPGAGLELKGLLVDWQGALAANNCQFGLTGQVQPMDVYPNFNFGPVAAMQARGPFLYMGLGSTAAKSLPTFLVFSLASSTIPILAGSLDNATTTAAGINALTAAGNYAYVASARAVSAAAGFGQLQIIDISRPQSLRLTASFKIPGVTGSSGEGVGSSIFYSKGLVYIGLTKTGSGPEFNIVDVHDPQNPRWLGGYEFASTVNSISVRDNYAYVAHPVGPAGSPQEQLTVLDVSDAANISRVSGFRAPDSQGNGKSLFMQGDNLFFGRTITNTQNPELAVFDVSAPAALFAAPWASVKISGSVNSLLAAGARLLALTNSQLKLFDFSALPSLWEIPPGSVLPAAMAGSSLACSGNTVYAAGGSASAGFFGFFSLPGGQ